LSLSYPYPSVENLIAATWIRLADYPVERRSSAVAANLVLDARKDVLAENRIAPALPGLPAVAAVDDITARSVIDTARSLNLASPESLRIVEMVYLEGLPSHVVGERYAMTAAAVRQRCHATVARLKAHRHVLADLAAA
jgi:DNA-directed RNA polymerase specialized sigma24 family protein